MPNLSVKSCLLEDAKECANNLKDANMVSIDRKADTRVETGNTDTTTEVEVDTEADQRVTVVVDLSLVKVEVVVPLVLALGLVRVMVRDVTGIQTNVVKGLIVPDPRPEGTMLTRQEESFGMVKVS